MGACSPRIAVPPLDPAAFAGWNRAARVEEIGGATMGTGWRVRFASVPGLAPEQLRRAIARLLRDLVAELSHWEPRSAVSRFNEAPAGTWHRLPPSLATVLRAAHTLADQTSGAFDPAIGALVDVHGFGPHGMAVVAPDLVPAALSSSGYRRLAFDPDTDRWNQPGGLCLDLSGIAKGHAVDRLLALCSAWGARHALVEIGGELAGSGLRPDGEPWWVDLETPCDGIAGVRVALHGLAVATSGDYVRGAHTIDPRSGLAVHHTLSVSVLHQSAMMADGWASALTVAPIEEASALARQQLVAARILHRTIDGITEWISPALAAMLE